jgi:hypothetical protein
VVSKRACRNKEVRRGLPSAKNYRDMLSFPAPNVIGGERAQVQKKTEVWLDLMQQKPRF